MHSQDLGPAMALAGARSQGTLDALKVILASAEATAAAIRAGAGDLRDSYDRTAALNSANFWDFFAENVRRSDWRLKEPPPKAADTAPTAGDVGSETAARVAMLTATLGPAMGFRL